MADHEEDFADQLGRFMKRAGFTQEELAGRLGSRHRNTIGSRLNRTRLPQSRGEVLQLADELSLLKEERKGFVKAAGFSVERWPTEIWTLPPRQLRDMFFTGREDILQSLRQSLVPRSTTAPTQALSGLGGIGKTHLAAEYAYRFHQYYEAIFWLQADSWEILVQECTNLTAELGLPEPKEANQAITKVQSWLQKHRHWLLILDNVENPQEILPKFVPSGHQGCVLVTTRILDVEPLAQTRILPIIPMSDGILFLLRRANIIPLEMGIEHVSARNREEAEKIWNFMGGLPLALDQAAAYIRERRCTLSAYREQYDRARASLLSQRGKNSIGHEDSVTTTFSLIFDQVSCESQTAADLLTIFAFFAPNAIPEEIITYGKQALGPLLEPVASDQFLLGETIEVLLRYSLIFRDSQEKTFSIHPLTQVILQDSMDPRKAQEWAEKAVYAFSQAYNTIIENLKETEKQHSSFFQEYQLFNLVLSTEAPLRLQRYLSHASNCVNLIEKWNIKHSQVGTMLLYIALDLDRCAYYSQAISFTKKAFTIFELVYGHDHSLMANLHSAIGRIYLREDRFKEAEISLQKAVNIQTTYLGLAHPRVSENLADLASLYNHLGNYSLSEKLYKEALDICQHSPSPDASTLVKCLQGLAHTYIEKKEYNNAESLLMRVLAMLQHGGGQETSLMISGLVDLAQLYCLQDKYIQAEIFSRQALAIQEQYLGTEHPAVTESLLALASVFSMRGKYAEAEELLMRVLKLHRKTDQEEDLFMAMIFNNIATCYADQKKYTQAEQFLYRTLEIMEQKLEPTHPHIIACLSNLIVVYYERGETDKVIQLRRQIVSLLSPDDPSNIKHLVHLAHFYLFQSQWEDAEQLYKDAEQLVEKHASINRSDFATISNGLGLIYLFQRRYTDAEYYLERALVLHRDMYGIKSLNAANSLENLADLYYRQGQYLKALSLCEQALAIYEECEGAESLPTAKCLRLLADIYHAQEMFLHAELLYQSALAISEKVLGPEHQDVVQCLISLAETYTKQEKYTEAIEVYHRAKKVLKRTLSLSGPQLIEIDLGLADAFQAQGSQEEAEKLYVNVLKLLKQTRPLDHLKIVSIVNRLARFYSDQRRYKEAESYCLQALDSKKHLTNDQMAELITTHHNLAVFYSQQGKNELAESHFLEALEIIEKVGSAQLIVAQVKENFATIYHKEGQHEQAEMLYQEALSIYAETIGFEHPMAVQCLTNTATLYSEIGNHQKALELSQRVQIILEQHPQAVKNNEVTKIFENLSLLYRECGQLDKAEQVWKKALAIRVRQYLNFDDDLEPIPQALLQAINDRQDREKVFASLSSREQITYKNIEKTLFRVLQALSTAVETYTNGDHTESRKIETILFYLSAKGFSILQPVSQDEKNNKLDMIPMGSIELDAQFVKTLQEDFGGFERMD